MIRKNDDKIITALLSCPTVKQAAEKCGITDRTIYLRLNDPDFHEKYETERRRLYDQSAAALQFYLTDAIGALGDVVNDREASPQTRVNAADVIIKNVLKLQERADILDRLDELERNLQQ